MRFLTDKYALEGPTVGVGSDGVADDADILDVEEILHELHTGDQTEAAADDPEAGDAK